MIAQPAGHASPTGAGGRTARPGQRRKPPGRSSGRFLAAVLAARPSPRRPAVWRACDPRWRGQGLSLPTFSVLHLFRVEIHPSARRHGITDEDIAHAYDHAVVWIQLGDDPARFLLAGGDRAGNLLELVVIDASGEPLVIHAMPLRTITEHELFGDDR